MIEVFHSDINCHLYQEPITLVATVDTDDLEQAFALTQHLEDNSWVDNNNIIAHHESPRSTSIGDYLVKDNMFYRCEVVGFRQIK